MENTGNFKETDTSLKPGYQSSFDNAERRLKEYWVSLLPVAVINALFVQIIYMPNYLFSDFYDPLKYWWGGLHSIFGLLIMIFLDYGFAFATLKAASGIKPSFIDYFRSFKKPGKVIFSALLCILIIGVGFILFIVPGIFFLCRLAFVPYFIVDQETGVVNAVKGSWKMTKGHFWKIFLIGLSFVGIILILFILHLFVGNIFQINWISETIFILINIPISLYLFLTSGSLYHSIWLERNEKEQVSSEEAPDPVQS